MSPKKINPKEILLRTLSIAFGLILIFAVFLFYKNYMDRKLEEIRSEAVEKNRNALIKGTPD